MKERPILFNTEMVRAILDGRKTQTRRIITPQPKGMCEWDQEEIFENVQKLNHVDYEGNHFFAFHYEDKESRFVKCPLGKPGDRLWVRETFCLGKVATGELPDGRDSEPYVSQCEGENDILFKEQMIREGICIDDGEGDKPIWKPSIFLKKKDHRIDLEITNIRIERVQDISEKDAIKEGFICRSWKSEKHNKCWDSEMYAKNVFSGLWDVIYRSNKLCWEANPWVWVADFKLIK